MYALHKQRLLGQNDGATLHTIAKVVHSCSYLLWFSLNVTIRYDDNFKGKFGADAENVIRRVMAHAQNIYQWPSLTTKIIFNVLSIAYRTGVWVTGDDGHGVWVEFFYEQKPTLI